MYLHLRLLSKQGIDDVIQSSGQLQVFIFAIIRHPEVMRRAQEELDQVVGRERLPTLGDQDKLIYIDAVIKEVLRWWPVAPLGMHPFLSDAYYC